MPPKRKKTVKASDIDTNIKKVKVEDSGANVTIKEEKTSPEGKKKKGRVPRIHKKPTIRKNRVCTNSHFVSNRLYDCLHYVRWTTTIME